MKLKQVWLKRRQMGSCLVCKKRQLVYVCLEPVRCSVCLGCVNKNKGPCYRPEVKPGRHKWESTLGPRGAADGQRKDLPKYVPDTAWFFCQRCEGHLV